MLSPRMRRFLPLALLALVNVFVALAAPTGDAQTRPPPQDLIGRGRTLFEDQQYEESIQTLSGALVRPGNTVPQKVEIYRYLALDYITLNRKEEAESAVRGLLVLQPGYMLPPTESPRFRDFFGDVKQRWDAEGKPGLVLEAAPPPAPVTMRHTSPSQAVARTQVDLTARLEDPAHRVVTVKAFYRTGAHGKFDETEALLEHDAVRASIPPEAVRPPLVEYYLQGFDKGGLPVVSRGDASLPMRIAIPEPTRGWILPVAIGGGVLVTAAIVVGGLFLGGAFHHGGGGGTPTGMPTMTMTMPTTTMTMPTTTATMPTMRGTSQVTIIVGP